MGTRGGAASGAGDTAEPTPADPALLTELRALRAEMLALRTVIVNVQEAAVCGTPMTGEWIGKLIAEAEKRAAERLTRVS